TTAAGGAAATTAGGATTTGAAAKGGTITMALPDVFSGYNQGTSAENLFANQLVTNQVIPSFVYFDHKGSIQIDKNLGDVVKTSDSPLTVDVKTNRKAVWSDGTPISCDDIYMYWVAQNGKLTTTGADGKKTGLFSNATSVGFDQIGDVKCSADNKTATMVFDTP